MWRVVLGMLVAAGVVLAIYGWQQKEAATTVSIVEVVRSTVDSRLQLTGTVINDRTVTLTALLDGEIMVIRAREGDMVEAGPGAGRTGFPASSGLAGPGQCRTRLAGASGAGCNNA